MGTSVALSEVHDKASQRLGITPLPDKSSQCRGLVPPQRKCSSTTTPTASPTPCRLRQLACPPPPSWPLAAPSSPPPSCESPQAPLPSKRADDSAAGSMASCAGGVGCAYGHGRDTWLQYLSVFVPLGKPFCQTTLTSAAIAHLVSCVAVAADRSSGKRVWYPRSSVRALASDPFP